MTKHQIRLVGPGAEGTRVSAQLLRDVLDVVIDGSKRALRMRTEGRSSARGRAPEWIEAATRYSVELRAGSTTLDLDVPTLLQAAPDEFRQRDAFPEVDPDRSSFDYFAESLAAAVAGDAASPLFDRGLLEVFGNLRKAFESGAERIQIGERRVLALEAEDIGRFGELEARIPAPQYARLAGFLDEIRHSDRTFTILTTVGRQRIKGIAEREHMSELQKLWGKRVAVSGTAHFTPAGGVLRIEADRIRPAEPKDETLWGTVPKPLGRKPSPVELRQLQGPRSGLSAVFGKWPGDESDEEVTAALEELS